MNDIFITAIEVKKVRNIENFTIPLSETERKHLIITGKNGSVKTSLLLSINLLLNEPYSVSNIISVLFNIKEYKSSGKINCLIEFFESKRFTKINIPHGIYKVDLKNTQDSREKLSVKFVQYIVNLKAERSFAKDDNDDKAILEIDAWFEKFEGQLKELFDAPDLQLIFDRKKYNFYIKIGDNEPFTLSQLSDGYSAVLSIITQLILRMEAADNKAHDLQGVVLIDEIETHLHVALQKKIMPFLCAFFPNIQFIVTTHSPFVISSISNAVICDLEKKEVISDLSGYSYDALVESYFDTDKYSAEIKIKLHNFETLSEKNNLTEEEEDEYYALKRYFDDLPKFRADELAVKLQEIKLKRMARKG